MSLQLFEVLIITCVIPIALVHFTRPGSASADSHGHPSQDGSTFLSLLQSGKVILILNLFFAWAFLAKGLDLFLILEGTAVLTWFLTKKRHIIKYLRGKSGLIGFPVLLLTTSALGVFSSKPFCHFLLIGAYAGGTLYEHIKQARSLGFENNLLKRQIIKLNSALITNQFKNHHPAPNPLRHAG